VPAKISHSGGEGPKPAAALYIGFLFPAVMPKSGRSTRFPPRHGLIARMIIPVERLAVKSTGSSKKRVAECGTTSEEMP
jgi:hypothetical protein